MPNSRRPAPKWLGVGRVSLAAAGLTLAGCGLYCPDSGNEPATPLPSGASSLLSSDNPPPAWPHTGATAVQATVNNAAKTVTIAYTKGGHAVVETWSFQAP